MVLRSALGLTNTELGPENPLIIDVKNKLALVLSENKGYVHAEELHRHVIALCERKLDATNPETLGSMVRSVYNLAVVLSAQGKHTEAEQKYRQVSELLEQVDGLNTPFHKLNLICLAVAQYKESKFESEEYAQPQVLELQMQKLGHHHSVVADATRILAEILTQEGKHVEAEIMYRHALEVMDSVLGRRHAYTLETVKGLVETLTQ